MISETVFGGTNLTLFHRNKKNVSFARLHRFLGDRKFEDLGIVTNVALEI